MIEHIVLKAYLEDKYGVRIVAKRIKSNRRYFIAERVCHMSDSWWILVTDKAFHELHEVANWLEAKEAKEADERLGFIKEN